MESETKHLRFVETNEMNWNVVLKDTEKMIGQVSSEAIGDILKITSLNLDEHEYMNEVVEMLCNTAFYRTQARKICMAAKDDVQKRVAEFFGFHKESVQDDGWHYVLYKEEYIMFLRRQGKAINTEKLSAMRMVFLVVSLAGLFLFCFDMTRGKTTLMTSLYAYLTGIGAAGAIFSAYLSTKKSSEQKDEDDENAR